MSEHPVPAIPDAGIASRREGEAHSAPSDLAPPIVSGNVLPGHEDAVHSTEHTSYNFPAAESTTSHYTAAHSNDTHYTEAEPTLNNTEREQLETETRAAHNLPAPIVSSDLYSTQGAASNVTQLPDGTREAENNGYTSLAYSIPADTEIRAAPETTHVEGVAPALPSHTAPLVDAHHDRPVDFLPESQVQSRIPFDTLDPEGARELSDRISDTERTLQREEADGGDPEKQSWGTADPFDTENRFSLEQFLREQLEARRERGKDPRQMGLAFRNLNVTGYGIGAKFNSTLGSVLSAPVRMITDFKGMFKKDVKHILKGIDGCVKPGEMLLVLGRPGSGSTTLLKSLCSYRDGYRSIEGEVLYEGFDHKAIDHALRGEVVYAPEDDVHFGTLSVKNTLDFAAASRTPRSEFRVTGDAKDSRRSYIGMVTEVIATVLGLRHTYNTKVGNDLIRGVSGGERKRVSIGEVLASHARIIMFDNSSRGLDSSTALEFIQALRITTDVGNTTTISSIYQAGESLSNLFDKVIVLNKGHCAYFGPMHKAADYFKSIGYLPHERQTTSDFLVGCTDPVGRRLNPDFKEIPLSGAQQAAAFRASEIGRANRAEVDAYMAEMQQHSSKESRNEYVNDVREQRTRRARKGSRYMLSWPQQVRLAIKRRAQIAWGDAGTAIIMACASLFQALIIGSVYYNMQDNTSALFSRSGVIFFALLYNSFSAMAEVPNSYAQRPVVIRQQRFGMLHPSADAIGNALLDIPVRSLSMTAFVVVLYFLSNLSRDAGKFFIFYFTTMLITFTMVAFFRMVTSITRSVAIATMVAGLVVIDCALYAGYAIPRPSMVIWWRWLSYCNPISFGFEVLMTNEYRGKVMKCTPNQTFPPRPDAQPENQVCAVAGAKPGQLNLNASDYAFAQYGYKWESAHRNVGIIIGFWIFFLILYMIGSEFQTDPAASGGVMVFKRGTISRSELEEAEARAESAIPVDSTVDSETLDKQQSEKFKGMLDVSDETFSWEHVNFDVMIKGNPRRLLNDVSGFVAPGKMTALMGESGAGKTTLLNVLAQRSDVGVVGGDFFVNGRDLPRSFQADTGYCQQQDVHLAQQTVREALQFSAMLRQSRETPKEDRLAYVETVIELLEMQSFSEALVGEVAEGLNVEQRKRLTIGVELAAKPSLLLFLDEPTSGLDAQAAWSVVRFLKKLANEGQAILCTIHQPSGELFNQFDRLLLLQKGGKTAYFGELGENSMTLIKYFEERSGVKCEENANPAEYMLDVIGAGATATTDKDWYQLYRESPQYAEMQEQLKRIAALKHNDQGISKEESARMNREYAQPFMVQLSRVTRRVFLAYWRDPTYLGAKLFLNIFGGLFIGSSFWGQGQKYSSAALQNKLFATFMSLVLSTSLSQQLQPVFLVYRNIFEVRERPSKLYSWPVFLIGCALVEIPWNIIGGTLFWVPWYFMVGFGNEGTRAGYSWGLYMLFQLYFCGFAQAVATVAPNAMIASILFSTFFSFVIVFCGVVQPPPQLPYFWRKWMYPLSPFTYIVEGMLGNAVHDKPVICEPRELNMVIPPPGQSCDSYLQPFSYPLDVTPPNPNSMGYYVQRPDGNCDVCSMRRGEDYLRSIEMNSDNRFRDLGILCAYIAFNFALIFFMYYIFRVHRWKSNKIKPPKEKKSKGKKGEVADAEKAAQESA